MVRYTELGEKIGMEAIQGLRYVESALAERIGDDAVDALRTALSADWGNPVKPE